MTPPSCSGAECLGFPHGPHRFPLATQIYRAQLPLQQNADLERACLVLARDDKAGQRWAKAHGYPGYTSYASLNGLPERMPEFAALAKAIDKHVAAFARALDFDGRRLELD